MNVFESSILVAALFESEFHHAACKTLVTSGTFGAWSHSFVETFNTHSGDGQFCVYPIRSTRTRDWKYIRNLHPEFQYHTHMSRATGPHCPLFWDT